MSVKKKLLWTVALIPLILGTANLIWIHHTESKLQAGTDRLEAYLKDQGTQIREEEDPPSGMRNAARWAQAGAGLIEPQKTPLDQLELTPATSLPLPLQEEIRAHIEAHSLPLSLIAEGATLDQASLGIFYDLGVFAQSPDILQFLTAGRLLLAKTQLNMADGDTVEAQQAVDGLRTLVIALANEKLISIQLVSYNLETLYNAGLKCVMESGADDPEFLERHARPIQPAHLHRFGRLLHFESQLIQQQRTYAHLQLGTWGSLRQQLLRAMGNLAMTRAMQRYRHLAEAAQATADDLSRAPIEPQFTQRDWPWLLFASGAMGNVLAKSLVAEARAHLRESAVALRLYALREGHYPQTLSELQLDVRNPLIDEPFSYRPTPEGGVVLEITNGAEIADQTLGYFVGHRRFPKFAPFIWQLPPVVP